MYNYCFGCVTLMETIQNRINSDLVIDEYKNGIRFGSDALLLSHFCTKGGKGCDLGCGSGVISLLLLKNGKAKHMTGVEKQKEYYDISLSNAEKNNFSDKFACINADVCDIKSKLASGSMDFVVTNPPYLKSDCGYKNSSVLKYNAFHETTADIDKFLACAGYILKSGGKLFVVYRPEHIGRLIFAMENNSIKLKRLRFVCPSEGKSPCLILAEGRKDGGDGCVIEANLNVYRDGTHSAYSKETEEIYNELA